MGVEFFPVLEDGSSIGGSAEWKAMARAADLLDEVATTLGVAPLYAFDSTLPEDFESGEMLEQINAEILAHDGVLPVRKWFEPDEAAGTVAALLSFCREAKDEFWQGGTRGLSDKESIVGILEEFEGVLMRAKTRKIRFHLLFIF